ncbi:phosphopantetheine-binding protein, partial [Acinetobacter baumannii]
MMMLSQEQVLTKLREWMEDLFEIEPETVQLDSNLYSDLDVDSIDAVEGVLKEIGADAPVLRVYNKIDLSG